MANGNFGGGDGTELNPYLIEDATDLNAVNGVIYNDSYAHFKLVADIDMKGVPYTQISDGNSTYYEGVFDGNNCTISNLTANQSGYYGGFFGYPDGATIKNLTIENAKLSGNCDYSGVFAGYIGRDSIVENCHVIGEIKTNSSYVGGFAGEIARRSDVSKCSVIASVENLNTNYSYVSGFATHIGANCSDCYAQVTISSASMVYAAGFVYSISDDDIKIRNCYSASKLNMTIPSNWGQVGAFVVQNRDGVIESCYFDLEILTDDSWQPNVAYTDENYNFVRGTDGKVYELINYQYLDVDANPITGSQWSNHWREVTPSTIDGAKTTEQMQTKNTFVGWDFENVWTIAEGSDYPRFEPPFIKCTAFPLSTLKVNVIN